jgi:hypothetical protein
MKEKEIVFIVRLLQEAHSDGWSRGYYWGKRDAGKASMIADLHWPEDKWSDEYAEKRLREALK